MAGPSRSSRRPFGERMVVSEAWLGVMYVAVLFLAAALLLKVRDRFAKARWRKRHPPERLAAEQRQLEKRLMAPDWAFYAEHLQRPVPRVLVSWFEHSETVLERYGFDDHLIDFVPIDRATSSSNWVVAGVVAFAESNGDPIYLKPGSGTDDSVFITYHDGGDTDVLAPSIEEFLARLEKANTRR